MDQERLFEERNIGLDICSTRTSSKNEMDREKKIDDQEVSEKCRMCGERDESVRHLIAECKNQPRKSTNKDMIILQKLYTWNYGRSLAQLVRLSGVTTNLQAQLRMTGSKYCGILMSKQAMSFNKTERKSHLIDIAVPGDKRIEVERTGKDRQLQQTKTGSE